MPIHKSVLKRERQAEKNRMINRVIKSKVYTAKKRLVDTIIQKNKEESQKKLSIFMSEVDKAVKKGIFHKNKGARLKSRATMKFKKAFDELAPVK